MEWLKKTAKAVPLERLAPMEFPMPAAFETAAGVPVDYNGAVLEDGRDARALPGDMRREQHLRRMGVVGPVRSTPTTVTNLLTHADRAAPAHGGGGNDDGLQRLQRQRRPTRHFRCCFCQLRP
jgi:hypothetical protein